MEQSMENNKLVNFVAPLEIPLYDKSGEINFDNLLTRKDNRISQIS